MRVATFVGWVLLVASACVRPETVACGDLICPATTSCAPRFGTCVSTDALVACDGLAVGASCQTSGGAGTCFDDVCIPLHCGDGVITSPEQCDGANVGGASCSSEGFYVDGVVTCAPDCTLDVSSCMGTCGDGVVNDVEACDGSTALTCLDVGFYQPGAVSCTSRCTLNTNACAQTCGDGVINGPETCDGAAPVLQCVAYGFDYGPTTCTASCSTHLASCGRIGWRQDPVDPTFVTSSVTMIDGWAYAGGAGGRVTRFNEGSSSSLGFGGSSTVNGVWGTSSSSLVAVTSDGRIMRYDGTTWTVDATVAPALVAVHGRSATEIWAVGNTGTILAYDGATWTPVADSGTTANLRAVYAVSSTDVVAVGVGGVIVRFDGQSWSRADAPGVTAMLSGVWGSASDDVYVAGVGTLLHWDGAWQAVPLPIVATQPVAVAGLTRDNVFVAQADSTPLEHVWHYDGAGWAELEPPRRGIGVRALAITPSGQVVLTGIVGLVTQVVWRYFAAGASAQAPSVPSIASIWSSSRDFIVAVGSYSSLFSSSRVIAMYKQGAWTNVVMSGGYFTDVWGLDASTIFAVGSPNWIYRYDGTTWQSVPHAVDLGIIHGVWGTSATDVFVTGTGGMIHLGPSGWQAMTLPAQTPTLLHVWGVSPTSVYAVGLSGTILHFDGLTWQPMTSGTSLPLHRVWGTSDTNVYALGADVLLRWDGVSWQPEDTSATYNLVDLRGSGPDDVFVLGRSNAALHWNGLRWAPVDLGIEPQDTIGSAVYADESQWIIGGQSSLFAPGVAMVRQYLRTGPGGLGR